MHPNLLQASRIHEVARARAHELREQALDAAWSAVAAAISRAWHACLRMPRVTLLPR